MIKIPSITLKLSIIGLTVISSTVQSQIPSRDIAVLIQSTTFNVLAETNIDAEDNQAAFLVDSVSKCRFFGKTRSEPKEGWFNSLIGQKNFFLDINSAVCERYVLEFNKITIQYEMPIKAGQTVGLPVFDALEKILPVLEKKGGQNTRVIGIDSFGFPAFCDPATGVAFNVGAIGGFQSIEPRIIAGNQVYCVDKASLKKKMLDKDVNPEKLETLLSDYPDLPSLDLAPNPTNE